MISNTGIFDNAAFVAVEKLRDQLMGPFRLGSFYVEPGRIRMKSPMMDCPADLFRVFSHYYTETPLGSKLLDETIMKYPEYFYKEAIPKSDTSKSCGSIQEMQMNLEDAQPLSQVIRDAINQLGSHSCNTSHWFANWCREFGEKIQPRTVASPAD